GFGIGRIFQFQNIRLAKLVDSYCFHSASHSTTRIKKPSRARTAFGASVECVLGGCTLLGAKKCPVAESSILLDGQQTGRATLEQCQCQSGIRPSLSRKCFKF